MAVDHIRYDLLAQDALRGVVRTVLSDAAKNGLPGEHHFFIAFDTRAEGVKLSARMRAQYPEEMTIVLQHQFWDLNVSETGFEVGLSFGGVPERLSVPFSAIKGFFDPSVNFGLQFQEIEVSEEEAQAAPTPTAAAGQDTARIPASELPQPALPLPSVALPANPPGAASPAPKPAEKPEPPKPTAPAGGEVVRLDRFRKK